MGHFHCRVWLTSGQWQWLGQAGDTCLDESIKDSSSVSIRLVTDFWLVPLLRTVVVFVSEW